MTYIRLNAVIRPQLATQFVSFLETCCKHPLRFQPRSKLRLLAVGCSVFEEHHRAGIERERERTNQREGQKYDNHMLAIWLSGAANVTRTQ